MSRIVLVGVGPLPSPRRHHVFAPGLRLSTFIRALHAAGHELTLVEIPFGTQEAQPSESSIEFIEHTVVAANPALIAQELQRVLGRHRYDAIVALTDVGAAGACACGYEGPIHIDYFGHPMAERQQQGNVHHSDAALAAMWEMVLPVLLRADSFSVCSKAQKYALIGELGVAGRLNMHTCGRELIGIVPPAIGIDEEPDPPTSRAFDRLRIPRESRVVLSTGGFNTWMDEETLFGGLQRVMLSDYDVSFVATGGRIEGHANVVFDRFHERVESSSFKERAHFLGWVEHQEFLAVCRDGHVAINCDLPSLEGEFGCRNRVLGWLWMGLRVVSTVVDEITAELAQEGLIAAFRPRDQRHLGEVLRDQLELPLRTEVERRELRRKLLERFRPERVCTPVVHWAERLHRAPDRQYTALPDNPLVDLQRAFLDFRAGEYKAAESDVIPAAKELAARLRGSRIFRATLSKDPEIADLLRRIDER